MRSEETQLAGLGGSINSTVLQPGTHSKWVELKLCNIMRFTTFMTGDLYSAVGNYIILRTESDTKWSKESFIEGVQEGYNGGIKGKGLLFELFQTRVRTILGLSAEPGGRSYLSGLLIGTEIAEAVKLGYTAEQPVIIIGSENLNKLYTPALNLCSIATIKAAEDLAAVGLFKIAREGNLI